MKEFKLNKKKNLNYEIIPNKKKDFRGHLTRVFCEKSFQKILKRKRIVQINYTYTKKKGTIRGLHYQSSPFKQDKFVICLKGKIFDIAVNLVKKSKQYLSWDSVILNENNNNIHFIPRGYAHGYQSLTDNCELIYLHTNFFSKKNSCIISPFDKKIKIKWPIKKHIISKKDKFGASIY